MLFATGRGCYRASREKLSSLVTDNMRTNRLGLQQGNAVKVLEETL